MNRIIHEEITEHRVDDLVQSYSVNSPIFATSIVARGVLKGRLYAFNLKGSFLFSDVHSRNLQLIADLTGVAIENHYLLQQTRRHESVDRQISIGAVIQSQLLRLDLGSGEC